MKRTLVIKYDECLLKSLKDQHIIVFIDSLEQLEYKYSEAKRDNHVVLMCANLPYTSLSQIEFSNNWDKIPLHIYSYNIGNYDLFFSKINTIRSLDVRLFVSNETESACTDLKIMASLGIDCGLQMKPGVIMDDDSFLDLASYYYMSPVPHATMEPFNYILRHLTEEASNGFNSVYFDNPVYFAHIASVEDYEKQEEEENNFFKFRLKDYYQHFLDLDECAKCPAFKICDRNMSDKLKDCKTTMNEIYEYAEMQENLNNRNTPKLICQL